MDMQLMRGRAGGESSCLDLTWPDSACLACLAFAFPMPWRAALFCTYTCSRRDG